MVRTRLQGHISRSPCGAMPARRRIPQSHHLGMRATGFLGMALANDGAISRRDDAADAGVGRGNKNGAGCEIQRHLHVCVHRKSI